MSSDSIDIAFSTRNCGIRSPRSTYQKTTQARELSAEEWEYLLMFRRGKFEKEKAVLNERKSVPRMGKNCKKREEIESKRPSPIAMNPEVKPHFALVFNPSLDSLGTHEER